MARLLLKGPLTDLHFKELTGTYVKTTFPLEPKLIVPEKEGKTPPPELWPPPRQPEPYDEPPLDETNTTLNGYSKQAYFFDREHRDWFLTVGPSLPKIKCLENGGAQFWVGSIV